MLPAAYGGRTSMGLAPMLVTQVFATITEINQEGTTILLVEQNAAQAL